MAPLSRRNLKMDNSRFEGRNPITASARAARVNTYHRKRKIDSVPLAPPPPIPEPVAIEREAPLRGFDGVAHEASRVEDGLPSQDPPHERNDAPDEDGGGDGLPSQDPPRDASEGDAQEDEGDDALDADEEGDSEFEEEGDFESDDRGGDTSVVQRSKGRKKGSEKFIPLLKKAVSGGPEIPELLISFEGHVVDSIRRKKGRDPLIPQQRKSQLKDWKLSDAAWCDIVRRSGLSHLQHIMYDTINYPLLSAFIERWHPETNSFHMPWGEMTITLHDVYYILGLRICGDAVVGKEPTLKKDAEAKRFAEFLHMDYKVIFDDNAKKHGISYSKLKEHCMSEAVAGKPEIVASGFLMYLIGSTLFTDKSQCRLPISYFSLVQDHEAVSTMSWGSATLSYLYLQLGKASRNDCKQIAGCLTLFESWIYHYIPALRPMANSTWDSSKEPCAMRWVNKLKVTDPKKMLVVYREALDQMTEYDVDWSPYGKLDFKGHLAVSRFHGMISFLSTHEPYMPDRSSRQFQRVQKIPLPIIMPKSAIRVAEVNSYKVEYEGSLFAWNSTPHHRIPLQAMGPPATYGFECSPDYLDWYKPRTRLVISPNAVAPQRQGVISKRIYRAASILQPWLDTTTRIDIPTDLRDSIRMAVRELTCTGSDESPFQFEFEVGGASGHGGEEDMDEEDMDVDAT